VPELTAAGTAAQERVREFWDGKPCDSDLSDLTRLSREYFLEIERQRYALQPHILDVIARIDWRGKRVLEIGSGVGTDARTIIGKGALYTGINVDRGSTEVTSQALRVFSLSGSALQRDATRLDFPDGTFDVVYSFGVLHHIPAAGKAVAEIHRVLRPGGELLVMLYNRASINYVLEIMLLRKLVLHLLSLPGAIALLARMGFPRRKLERHRELAGLLGRMTDDQWLSRNTDGPDNPHSMVYDTAQAAALLSVFHVRANEVRFFDHRHWGVLGRLLPRAIRDTLGRRWGWHRIVHAVKV
jgi:SAM-dependent methyltransferase